MSTVDVVAPLAVTGPVLLACVLLAVGRWTPRVVTDTVALLGALALAGAGGLLLEATTTHDAVTWLGGWAPPPGAHPVGIALVVDPAAAGARRPDRRARRRRAALQLALLRRRRGPLPRPRAALLRRHDAASCSPATSSPCSCSSSSWARSPTRWPAYKIEEARSLQGGLTFGVVNSLGAYLALCGIGVLYARTGQLGLAPVGEALAAGPPDGAGRGGRRPRRGRVAGQGGRGAVPLLARRRPRRRPDPGLRALLRRDGPARGVRRRAGERGRRPPGCRRMAPVLVGVGRGDRGARRRSCASLQRNLKRLLAYSTIAHIGLFLIGGRRRRDRASGWSTSPGTPG